MLGSGASFFLGAAVFKIIHGDCLSVLKRVPEGKIHTCVTSPPYFGLRDYGHSGQIGLEDSVQDYLSKLVEVFREVRRTLRPDGTLWVNMGDSYGGGHGGHCTDSLKQKSNRGTSMNPRRGDLPKQILGIPWLLAFALQSDGWILRQDIIWNKTNAMPESVLDRCTKSHEYIFLLSKSLKYYFDSESIREPAVAQKRTGQKGYLCPKDVGQSHLTGKRANEKSGLNGPTGDTRNKRSVWTIPVKPFKGAHFATFPVELIEPCILAGSPTGGNVLDPFSGSGTTGVVADRLGRSYLGVELNKQYVDLSMKRIFDDRHTRS